MTVWHRWAVLLGLLLSASAAALAPGTPQFRVYGTRDGLPSETVFALAEDADGMLWLGTADGLARFDGRRFEVWQHDPERPDSLPGNHVQALYVDPRGQLWLATEGGGLSRRSADGRGFEHYRRGALPGLELDDVWAITSTPDGALWFGGFGGGLYRLAPDSRQLDVFHHAPADPHSLAAEHVLALAVDAGGSLWVGTTAGLDRYTDRGFEHQRGLPSGPGHALIVSLGADRAGRLWLGTGAGLLRRETDGRIVPVLPADAPKPAVTALLVEHDDELWLGTRNGLEHWRAAVRDRRLSAGRSPDNPGTQAVVATLRDHEGGLWFGSVGIGLLHLPAGRDDFSVFDWTPGHPDRLSSRTPRGLAESRDGRLWLVGKGGGLDRLDPDSGRIERLLSGPKQLPDHGLNAVAELPDGQVWIGHVGGLSVYDPAHDSVRSLDPDGPDAPAGAVDQLLGDGADGFWASVNGVALEHHAADGALTARYRPGDGHGLLDGEIEQLAPGPDGRVWLATGHGLFRLTPTGAPEPVAGGPDGHVDAFVFDGRETLWTHRLGALERWRLDGTPAALRLQRQQRLSSADGVPPVEAGGLAHSADGSLWLTTRRGLWRRSPDGRFRRYGVRDGLASQEFLERPLLVSRQGLIAAGTLDGLLLFDPLALHAPARTPALGIADLEVLRDGRMQALAQPADGGPVALAYGDREFAVRARLATFAPSEAQRFRFRLRGFDNDWIDVGGLGERRFSQLPPGDYTLEIEAELADAPGPPATLQLPVSAAPPWWASRSARAVEGAALLLLFGGLALAVQRRQARRLRLQLAEQQRRWALAASEAKSRFLATLGHEIRTPMTGVLGMTELLLGGELKPSQRQRAEAIQRSGELMLRLVNDALDLARIEAGKLVLLDEPFDLRALLEQVATQQAPLAAGKGLQLELQIAPTLPRWRRGDRLRLTQVLLNLLGNAIKFTDRGRVALRVDEPDGALRIDIEDTGPGLSAEQRQRLFRRFEQADGASTTQRYGGSGLGLAISQELVHAMAGRIDVDSTPGQGSCFRIRLPLPIAEPVAPEPLRTPSRSTATPQALLLVEDDPAVAAALTGLLAAQGHFVAHAPHGLAAMSLLAERPFDLAFVDLDLPGVDGLTLAGLLHGQWPTLPLVAVTARADPEAEPNARAAGFARFLRKPVSGAELAAAIAGCVPGD